MEPEFPVWVERTLIPLAVFTSSVLAVATGFQNRLNEHLYIEIFVVSVTAIGCILCGLFGLLLYLTEQMSLDAFGVVLIGLLPGLEAAGKLRISELFARARMRKKPALHNRIAKLQYLRHGRAPKKEEFGELQCSATTYLRNPASSRLEPKDDLVCSLWHGQVLGYNEKVIILKDLNDTGDAVRWWRAANNAVEVARDPSMMRVQKRSRAIRALELVAEIAMIGDSVLKYHSTTLRKFAKKSRSLSEALSATPASVCAAFLDSVGLSEEWGPVNDTLRNNFVERFDDLNRAKRYGMLFFILLNESRLFQKVTEKTVDGRSYANAEKVIQSFKESEEPSSRKSVTLQWLSRYGLNPDRLNKHGADDRGIDNSAKESSPAHSYVMIPLHDDACVPDQTVEFTVDLDNLPSTVRTTQRRPVRTSSQISGSGRSGVAGFPDRVPSHVAQGLSGEIRVLLPITRPGSSRRGDDPGSGSSGRPADTAGYTVGYDPLNSPAPPPANNAGRGQTTNIFGATGSSHNASSLVPAQVAVNVGSGPAPGTVQSSAGASTSNTNPTVGSGVPTTHDPDVGQTINPVSSQGTVH